MNPTRQPAPGAAPAAAPAGGSKSSGQTPWWRVVLVGRRPKRTLVRIAVLAGGSFVVFSFALVPFRIEGSSMEPTYRHGAVNFANRLVYLVRRPRRGDVVAIRTTAGPHVMYLKRVIGLPGERIGIRDGTVFVNGAPLDEPYVQNRRRWQRPEIQLAADEYYVMGDNRRMRMEDQEFGRCKASLIVGKVLF